jgi:hypothetical protein
MCWQVIEHHNVATPKPWGQAPSDPVDEPLTIHGAPASAQGQPAVRAHRSDHGQIVAPVHRPWLYQNVAARQPRMRPTHRQVRPGFIKEYQPSRIYRFRPPSEAPALGLDIRTILFRRPGPFFLNTYPLRCSARSTLDLWTRRSGMAQRLYSRVNSSVVLSGRSVTNRCSNETSTGDTHPPPLSVAATVPVSRARCTQRINVARWIVKCSATSLYVPLPDSYARTARSRSSSGYGFAMCVRDHKPSRNTSEFWG